MKVGPNLKKNEGVSKNEDDESCPQEMDTLDKRSKIESEITKLTDEENEAKTTGKFDNIPPPPNGIYKNIKELTASIKEFAQLHGYAIVTKRTITGKSVT